MSSKTRKPFFWICGNYYECRKKWNQIKQAVPNANIVEIDCGTNSQGTPDYLKSAEAPEIIHLLKNKDIFDNRPRILRLNGLPENYSLLSQYFHLITDDNIVVINSQLGMYKGRSFASAANSTLYKKIQSDGHFIDFGNEAKTVSDAKKWIKSVVSDLSKTIEDNACDLLIEMKGKNYDVLYIEINKIIHYDNSKKITIEAIKECCVSIFEKKTWTIIENLDLQQYSIACEQMEEFFIGAGSEVGDSFRGDIERFLGALSYHFLLLHLIKDGCENVLNADKAVSYATLLKKKNENSEIKSIYDKYSILNNVRNNSFVKAFATMSKSKIYNIRLCIERCKYAVRTSQSSTEGCIKIFLNSLIMVICGIVKEQKFLELIGKEEAEIDTILSIRK